jgi:hypothetical protein
VIARLIAWWKRNPRLARHATLAAIRQEMMMHPVDKGEHWRDDTTRVREIIEVIRECNERPTFDAIARQFRFETGRDLPEVWKRSPPSWLRRRVAEDEGAPPASVDRED